MSQDIDRIFDAYEQGALTRRDVLAAVASFVVAGGGTACASPPEPEVDPRWAPTLVARGEGRSHLNHVNLRVADVERSFGFYQRFFGFGLVKTPTYNALD